MAARHVGGDGLGEHEAGGVGHGHAVGQPGDAEIGDRGNVDQNFADHDEEDGERQQLPRQAEATPRRGPARAATHLRLPALAVAGSVVHRLSRIS